MAAIVFALLCTELAAEGTVDLEDLDDLDLDAVELDTLEVTGTVEESAEDIEAEGFNVDAIETYDIKEKSITINQVLEQSPGVNVRQSGGMGSETTYSMAGMSGDSVRFFVDGVPMEYFGDSYSANNIPPSLLSRIDIYKGVVPVDLGSDNLAGAINLVTNPGVDETYLDLSQSAGSFSTYQTTLQAGTQNPNTGLFGRFDLFHNQSENDYEVWGEGVRYLEGLQYIEFTEDNPAKRFNDDFTTTNAKLDLGYKDLDWADEISLGLISSDLDKGLQLGGGVTAVYGDVRIEEKVSFPYLIHRKSDWGWRGLNTNLFIGNTDKETFTNDTSRRRYDWSGNFIDSAPGEISDSRPLLRTLFEDSWTTRLNAAFDFNDYHRLGMNLNYTKLDRRGEDPLAEVWEQAQLAPQDVTKTFFGVALESYWLDDRLSTNVFTKYYDYEANVTTDEYDSDDPDDLIRSQVVTNTTRNGLAGFGFAAAYDASDTLKYKISIEDAARLPTAEEALGDGINYLPSPDLGPEKSLNLNLGIGKRFDLNDTDSLQFEATALYRDTEDMMVLQWVQLAAPPYRFQNLDNVVTQGLEASVVYSFRDFLTVSANATVLDIRNDTPFDSVNNRENLLYRDRLPNIPYELANLNISADFYDWFQPGSSTNLYWNTNYVHEYFLSWPSLGDADTKRVIPEQLSHDAGVSYTFPNERLSLAFDVTNLTDEQLFDNWRLQKPGRAFFLKVSYSY
ncbi:MAG: TonB-dependent receptor plug domain-containing protein [Pseudomonadota bacterium]